MPRLHPGDIEPERAADIEEAIWERLHFATHLRSQRLGEFTIGNDLHRSESLALVQLLILYQLVTAKAAIALGGESARTRQAPDFRTRDAEEKQGLEEQQGTGQSPEDPEGDPDEGEAGGEREPETAKS